MPARLTDDASGRADELSRRRFLAALGMAGAGSLAFGLCGCSPFSRPASKAVPTTASFVTRGDLRPPLISSSLTGAVGDGLIFLTAGGPLIVDNEGNAVWYQPVPSGTSVADFKVQLYQGQPVITWWQGKVLNPGYGQGVHILMNGRYQQVSAIQAANGYQTDLHDLQLTPEGTALLTVFRPIPADLSSLGGSASGMVLEGIVQEIDLASGRLLLEWHSYDHVAPTESHTTAPKTANQPYDYFHINSVAVTPDGNLLISARNTWALYKLHRKTGNVIWRLGGKQSDFALGAGVQFSFQHDPRFHGNNNLTLFDDGAGPPNVEPNSRGLSLNLDEGTRTVTVQREFVHSPELLSTSQGNVQVLDNGNVFVGWGSEPYFSEYTATGRQVFTGKLATLQAYRAFRLGWTGQPVEPPRIAVRSSGAGAVEVFASWNGATDVARWEVVADSGGGSQTPVGSAARSGFETKISVKTTASKVAARAVDRSGKVLGVSALVAT